MIAIVSKQELVAKGLFAQEKGAQVCIVGMWIWAKFPTKPAEEVRTALSTEGFHWSKSKGRWYFVGALSTSPRPHSYKAIVERYGEEELDT